MIDVSIGTDGKPSSRCICLGNKYENNDEIVRFNIPDDYRGYAKYVIAVHHGIKNVTKIFPVEDSLAVSSGLTYLSGKWYLYLMCREDEIDYSSEDVDISARDGEHVFISDGIVGIVNESMIEKESVDNIPMDTNIRIVYDDLVRIKKELEGIVAGSVSWENILNKPENFPPEAHSHDDIYYTEAEIDQKIRDVSAGEVENITNEEIESLFRARGWRLV